MIGAAQCPLAFEPGCLPYAYRAGSVAALGDASRRLKNFLQTARPTIRTREDTTIRHQRHNANASRVYLTMFVLVHLLFTTSLRLMTELQSKSSTTNIFAFKLLPDS